MAEALLSLDGLTSTTAATSAPVSVVASPPAVVAAGDQDGALVTDVDEPINPNRGKHAHVWVA